MKATKDHISLETAKMFFNKECPDAKMWDNAIPIYTWGEILWENATEFFGQWEGKKDNHEYRILDLLQQKKYEEADLYFRKNCILINK